MRHAFPFPLRWVAVGLILLGTACVPPPSPVERVPIHRANVHSFRDASHLLHGIFAMATFSWESEAGHPRYRPELAGEPMARQARLWMRLREQVEESFFDGGRFLPHPLDPNDPSPREVDLTDFSHGVYAYHMHKRSARFASHGLEDALVYAGIGYLVRPGIYLMRHHFREGRFEHHLGPGAFDKASMVHGLAGMQGHVYAWVRWAKPAGRDDMGRLSQEDLKNWMVYGPDALVEEFARPAATVLLDAWDQEAGIYRFDDDLVWSLDELGSLLRGLKVVYETLYLFGTDEDRSLASTLASHAARVLEGTLALSRPWGLPDAVSFNPEGVRPESEETRAESLWSFVNHLGGGFAIFSQAEGSSALVVRGPLGSLRRPLGEAIDQWITHALAQRSIGGMLPTSYRYADGTVLDSHSGIAAVGIAVVAITNHYQWGGSFVRASEWGTVDPGTASRSRALYDFLWDHQRVLEGVAHRWLLRVETTANP